MPKLRLGYALHSLEIDAEILVCQVNLAVAISRSECKKVYFDSGSTADRDRRSHWVLARAQF